MTGERSAPTPSMNAAAQSHEELKAMTDAAQPAGAQVVADGWAQLAAGFDEAVTLFDRAMVASEAGWTGAAADAMRAHLAKVAGWSRAMSVHYEAASAAITTQAETAESAKSAMPPPVPYDPAAMIRQARDSGDIFQMATLPARIYEQKQKHDAAHDEAVRIVTERDKTFGASAATIPPFEPPPRLADTQVAVPPPAPARETPNGSPPVDIPHVAAPNAGGTSPAGAGAPAPSGATPVPAQFGPPAPAGPGFGPAPGSAFGPGGFGPGAGFVPVAPAPRGPGDFGPAGPEAKADEPRRPEYLVESELPGIYGNAELTAPPVIGEA